ncbi:MAG: pyruvate synthase subunit beta [Deltaproteobacteria bacterium]|nr:pyruvate synthase subunit beta [Deltaproteobacteria bacterium]
MQDFTVYVPNLAPKDEEFKPGHRACQGCGLALAVRLALKASGKDVVVATATGCLEIISTPLPYTAWGVPWIHVCFENTGATASGMEAALKVLRRKGRIPDRKVKVLAFAGDGGTVDIGLQALSGALERGHDLTYMCLDNEAYMNTGVQRSGSTPYGASTTTSPAGTRSIGQHTWKKNMPAIAAAHDIPYVATCNPSYPYDFMKKVERSFEMEGPAYLHAYSACPTGWHSATELSIHIGRMAVQTGVHPLYEITNGKLTLNEVPEKLQPLKEYMKLQPRFRHLTDDDIAPIEERVHREWESLKARAAADAGA